MFIGARRGLLLNVTGGVAASSVVHITQVDHGEDTSDASEYTFTSKSLGSAAADRIIIVGVGYRANHDAVTLSVTVAGNSATSIVSQRAADFATTMVELWAIAVPSGSTGDVVVTLTGASGFRCGINVWRMVGAASATASDTGSSLARPATDTLTIPTNGAAVGYIQGDGLLSGPVAWTNLTESLALTEIEGGYGYAGAMADFTTGGSTALTVDYAAEAGGAISAVFATWGP